MNQNEPFALTHLRLGAESANGGALSLKLLMGRIGSDRTSGEQSGEHWCKTVVIGFAGIGPVAQWFKGTGLPSNRDWRRDVAAIDPS
jgi:hypothetical protein